MKIKEQWKQMDQKKRNDIKVGITVIIAIAIFMLAYMFAVKGYGGSIEGKINMASTEET